MIYLGATQKIPGVSVNPVEVGIFAIVAIFKRNLIFAIIWQISDSSIAIYPFLEFINSKADAKVDDLSGSKDGLHISSSSSEMDSISTHKGN